MSYLFVTLAESVAFRRVPSWAVPAAKSIVLWCRCFGTLMLYGRRCELNISSLNAWKKAVR